MVHQHEKQTPRNNAPLNNIANSVYEAIKKRGKPRLLLPSNVEPCPCDMYQSYQSYQSRFSATWIGLTSELVFKYIKTSITNTTIHQRGSRKKVQPTRQGTTISKSREMTTDPIPFEENDFYTKAIHINGIFFSNLTISFPVT